ncbi:hypothetical protein BaRGS_00020033 [Batillaria attramentaria]|uniref:Uncharacterized protein n=1 Tax=Batillaria attramentaria TaxID=370345 RepID=A0ABD0KP88_9CAEN
MLIHPYFRKRAADLNGNLDTLTRDYALASCSILLISLSEECLFHCDVRLEFHLIAPSNPPMYGTGRGSLSIADFCTFDHITYDTKVKERPGEVAPNQLTQSSVSASRSSACLNTKLATPTSVYSVRAEKGSVSKRMRINRRTNTGRRRVDGRRGERGCWWRTKWNGRGQTGSDQCSNGCLPAFATSVTELSDGELNRARRQVCVVKTERRHFVKILQIKYKCLKLADERYGRESSAVARLEGQSLMDCERGGGCITQCIYADVTAFH